jgi:homoserine dehydrogenase
MAGDAARSERNAMVKVSPLSTVLMDNPLKPEDIKREGSRGLSLEQVQSARMVGRPYMLVCQAKRRSDGPVIGSVRPGQVPHVEPLSGCDGATSITLFQMDVILGPPLRKIHPDAVTTAYGPLAEFVTIAPTNLEPIGG